MNRRSWAKSVVAGVLAIIPVRASQSSEAKHSQAIQDAIAWVEMPDGTVMFPKRCEDGFEWKTVPHELAKHRGKK